MKRTLLAVLSASLLLCGLPSVAAAHHGKRHATCAASRHKHHAKCARAHVLSFGASSSATSMSTPGSAPTTPTSPQTAGTVTSFATPTLTITLNDTKKTEVSGKVTENTRIDCESPTPPTPSGGDDEGDDDGGGGGSGDSGDDSGVASGSHDSMMARAADSSGDDEGEDDDNNLQPCTTSALTSGRVVRFAELILGSEGAVWERVILGA